MPSIYPVQVAKHLEMIALHSKENVTIPSTCTVYTSGYKSKMCRLAQIAEMLGKRKGEYRASLTVTCCTSCSYGIGRPARAENAYLNDSLVLGFWGFGEKYVTERRYT